MRRRKLTREEIDQARLDRVRAVAGEHFSDFLILARTSSGVIWRQSDRSWSMGAVRVFDGAMDEDNRHQRRFIPEGD